MTTLGVEQFGKALVREVRDTAIEMCSINLDAEANSVVAQRWRKFGRTADHDELLKMVIADAVDAAVFQLLNAIDDERVELLIRLPRGALVDLAKEGSSELAGWYMGSDGWRSQYWKQLYIDDFADLG